MKEHRRKFEHGTDVKSADEFSAPPAFTLVELLLVVVLVSILAALLDRLVN